MKPPTLNFKPCPPLFTCFILTCIFLIFPDWVSCQKMTLSRQIAPVEISKSAVNAILDDSYGFIWYGGSGLHRHDGQSSKAYKIASDSSQESLGTVYALLEDSRGRIWIGAANGLFLYERETDQLIQCYKEKFLDNFGSASDIMALYEDSKSRIWIGGKDKIFVINAIDRKVVKIIDIQSGTSYHRASGVRCIREDYLGRIYAATTNGLWEINDDFISTQYLPEMAKNHTGFCMIFDAEIGMNDSLWLASSLGLILFETTRHYFTFINIPGYESNLVRELFLEKNSQLWIANKNEIWRRDINGALEQILTNSSKLAEGINVYEKDRFGNLWVGGNNGLGRMDLTMYDNLPVYKIESILPNQDNFFFRVMQDSAGGFWFRMLNSGLGYCPKLGGEFRILLQPPLNIANEEIKNFCTDADGNVWVITLTNGLYLFLKDQTKAQLIDLGDSMYVASTASILVDNQNRRLLWFSSKFGLCSVDRFTFQRKWYHPKHDLHWLDRDAVGQFEQAEDGNIWCVLTSKNKTIIGYFDLDQKRFFAESELPGRPDASRGYQLKRVPGNKIWIATNIGLTIIDTEQKKQTFISEASGLPTKNVMNITPDRNGNVWYATGTKFCKYDGSSFDCYNANEAIGGFVHTSSALTKDGKVVFGGSNGLQVFDPEKITKDTIHPKIYLTNFRVFNKERNLGQANELVKEISLPFNENVFSLEFSALHFIQPKRIQYKHKLEGFEKEWVETGSDERTATYTNLSPGTYHFKVLAANANGYWTSEAEGLNIKLTILPPWYRTWWAYLCYTLAFGGLLYAFRRYELRRHLAHAEARHFKELDTLKNRLFTNITHEFRTPLTVILGMAEQVKLEVEKLEIGNSGNEMNSGVISQFLNFSNSSISLIKRNGQQLLHLVNQLLDLARLESGSMPLHYIHGNIVAFVKYLVESFHSFADSKDIRLHFLGELVELDMDYDPEKLQNIVVNLLSNAIKFTPAGGDIYFSLKKPNDSQLELDIRDTGIGIPPEDLPHIFDRFYQVDDSSTRLAEGTGIGLSVCKELVQLMGGSIHAESEMGLGSRFYILLPIAHQYAGKETIQTMMPDQLVDTFLPDKIQMTPLLINNDTAKRPLLLIIEDNADVISYLISLLSNQYEILSANNGLTGIEMAFEQIPDLIVSDVMMPGKDGFQVCETLKLDERTSHIPIILLTAKSNQSAKMEGLAQGADAYLSKPFYKEELLVRIEKLIANRKLLQQKYGKANFTKITKIIAPTGDELFLQKLVNMVEEHISDENFGMPELCKQSAMSRTQLFRKLKALTGKSATRFIRTIRLEKAKELLENTDMNIAEIAFETGFGSAAYFSRVFQEEYGMAPSSARNH